MTQSRVYKTEAIILRRIKLGEADRILTLYTPDHGKVKAVAKGTRRPKSKLGGHVELLTHSQLLVARGRNLDIITQAQTIGSFLPLKNDLKLLSQGLYVSELVDAFTAEDIENAELFYLLRDTLDRLASGENSNVAIRYFELHLLDYLGYRPQLRLCVLCNIALQPIVNYFSSGQGGAVCPDCVHREPMARHLSLNALKVLRLWQNCAYEMASRVRINAELALELEELMREYIRYLLEKQVKSVDLMDRLRGEPKPAPDD
jgi:DNA repair protein RecO (recombination protein O)